MSTCEDIKRFYALNIDFESLGLAPWGPYDVHYFCTPENAECFASVGVDGIHYCLLPGEETVYVVRPCCCEEGRYVLPVAGNFREFLSFLLYCGNEAAIEQSVNWDASAFHDFLSQEEKQITPEARAALDAVTAAFDLEPQEPFEKVKALQAGFNPAVLMFSDEYYDIMGLENPRA